jgi:hypothetical protein
MKYGRAMRSLNDSYVPSSRRGYHVVLTTKRDCSAKKFLYCVLAYSRSLLKKSDCHPATHHWILPRPSCHHRNPADPWKRRGDPRTCLLCFSSVNIPIPGKIYGGLAVIHRDTIRARSILPEAHPANFLKAGSLPPVQLNRLQPCWYLPPTC